MSDTDYCYPPTYRVLKNKLNIREGEGLDRAERRLVVQRVAEGIPSGGFDLVHLRAIHLHLFQDVYAWAGELRTVEITKGGHQFQFRRFIETGMADVHRRLVAQHYLRNLSAAEFAASAAEIMGDVNYVHPFREGNGRAQLLYLAQLAEQAGHAFNVMRIDRDQWIGASREAHLGRYDAMAACIAAAMAEV